MAGERRGGVPPLSLVFPRNSGISYELLGTPRNSYGWGKKRGRAPLSLVFPRNSGISYELLGIPGNFQEFLWLGKEKGACPPFPWCLLGTPAFPMNFQEFLGTPRNSYVWGKKRGRAAPFPGVSQELRDFL